jgi:hypothetical protein
VKEWVDVEVDKGSQLENVSGSGEGLSGRKRRKRREYNNQPLLRRYHFPPNISTILVRPILRTLARKRTKSLVVCVHVLRRCRPARDERARSRSRALQVGYNQALVIPHSTITRTIDCCRIAFCDNPRKRRVDGPSVIRASRAVKRACPRRRERQRRSGPLQPQRLRPGTRVAARCSSPALASSARLCSSRSRASGTGR